MLQDKELNYPNVHGADNSSDDGEDPAGFHSNMNDNEDHRRVMMQQHMGMMNLDNRNAVM